jgi:type III restriction enzyme
VPGVNNLGSYGRWAFAEFRDVYEIESDFEASIAKNFHELLVRIGATAVSEP